MVPIRMCGYGNPDRMRRTSNVVPRRTGPTWAVLVALVLAGSLLTGGAAEAALPCFGRVATIVGTRGDDLLVGTTGDDVIVGLRGFDRIRGRGGDDRICGGGDSDVLRGGAGDDAIEGNAGSDSAHGGPGADRILLGAGAVEALFGGPGDDRLFGGPGSFDGLIGGGGDDLLHGGPGQDLAEFFGAPNGVTADLETGTATGQGDDDLLAVEGLVGSNFDDVLLGDGISNLISAQEGDDVVDARGSGTLAGLGADLIDGGAGADALVGGAGDDIVTFEDSPGPVTADLSLGTAKGWGTDALSGFEAIVGTVFGDRLTGDAQDNAFAAGAGDDAIDGRGGIDQAAYFDAAGPVAADLQAGVVTGWGTDALVAIEDLTGSAFGDVLTGDGGPNAIVGGSGPDLLAGAAGDDLLIGANGTDQADGGDGLDTCDAETEVTCEADPASARAPDGGWLASEGNRRFERPV
jgi:Ca2+-binding RTX toxin-like protein